MQRLLQSFFVQAMLVCFVPLGLWSQNVLSNPGFNTPQADVPPGTPVAYTDFCYAGISAAADWSVWVNNCSPGGDDISTVLVPSTLPQSTGYMMHVVTDGNANGIGQTPFRSQETNTLASLWVYINSGCVLIGTGDGGDTGLDEATCETGRWFHFLRVPNGVTPATEFIVYSLYYADFYVKDASVIAAQ
jgi:hypothetical protein